VRQIKTPQKRSTAQIGGDESGLGGPVRDRLAESGWPIRRGNNGSPARDAEHYANTGAEIWFEGRRQIERQQIILPNDRELIAQLTSRLGWPDSKRRLQLESKEDMRGRNLPSPDRADAVLGAMMPAHVPAKFEYERAASRPGAFRGIELAPGACKDRWPILGLPY
jgi:hypothetical protein